MKSCQKIIGYFLLLAALPPVASAQFDCGSLTTGAFGRPLDYTSVEARTKDWSGKTPIKIVENVHFNSRVEQLISGQTAASPLGDIEYTLRAFPNHHRALHAISRLQRGQASAQFKKDIEKLVQNHRAECFFERAIAFKPDDALVHMLYGIHLHGLKKYDEALTYYKNAERLAPQSAELQYNMGLLYLETNQYDRARQSARLAYDKGYPLPGLRDRLKRAGHW